MSKYDVHNWLSEQVSENNIKLDLIYDIRDRIKSELQKSNLEIKRYSGNKEDDENIFLMHLIKFLYLNWSSACPPFYLTMV